MAGDETYDERVRALLQGYSAGPFAPSPPPPAGYQGYDYKPAMTPADLALGLIPPGSGAGYASPREMRADHWRPPSLLELLPLAIPVGRIPAPRATQAIQERPAFEWQPRPSLFPDEEMAMMLAQRYPASHGEGYKGSAIRGGSGAPGNPPDYWGTAEAIARNEGMTYAPNPAAEMINGHPRDPTWFRPKGRMGFRQMQQKTEQPANEAAPASPDRALYERALLRQLLERDPSAP